MYRIVFGDGAKLKRPSEIYLPKGMSLNVEKVKPAMGVADEPDYGHCVATIGRLGMEVDDMKVKLVSKELNNFLHFFSRKGKNELNLYHLLGTLASRIDVLRPYIY